MSNFVKIRKHKITSAGFDSEYPNGYGEVLPHLTLKLTSGDKIELYREDAIAAWEKLNKED